MRAITAAALVCLLGIFSVSAQAETSKIVAVLPLSGRLANVGKDLQNAISLQDTKSVSVVYEDDAFDPKNTVSVVQKFLTDPQVKGFIFFGSGTSLAAKPLIERSSVPGIAIAMSDKIVEGSRRMFRYYLPTAAQAERISEEVSRRGYKNVAYMTSQQEAMLAFQAYFQTHASAAADRCFEVQPGETDLRSAALRALTLHPDAIALLLLPPELSNFAKQARALGFKGDFFGPTQLGNPEAVRAADGSLENTWFTGVDEKPAREMIERFRSRFGGTPTSEGVVAFDAAKLLASAAESADSIGYLSNLSGYRGLFGERLAFVSPNTFLPPLALKTIRDSRFEQRE